MTNREIQILDILKSNPTITHDEIAKELFITRSTVSVHITNLIEKGYIKGKGYIFNEDYVVCIGTSNVDISGFASSELMLKDKNPNATIEISPGGVARNIGENLAIMGVSTKMLTAVGDDIYGDLIINESKKSGMDMSDVRVVNGGKSCLYISLNGPSGDMEVGMTDMGLGSYINRDYMKSKSNVLNKASVIVLSPCVGADALSYIRENFHNKPIFIDVVAVDYADTVNEFMDLFHTVKANIYEAEALCGIKIKDNSDVDIAASRILKKGAKNVYITLGEDGVYYKNNKGSVVCKKSYPVSEVVSCTGAGDAFMAGAVYSFLNRFDENKSVKFAGVSASMALLTDKAINHSMNTLEILEKVREY